MAWRKGRKDRVVPIGRRAMAWLDRYIREARPGLMDGSETSALFLRSGGRPLPLQRMTQLVHGYICRAGLPGARRGSCHALRHTAATLMLDQGADVRYIQAMLGHAKLSTTQVYTHVSIRQLQDVHSRTHPADRRWSDAGKPFKVVMAACMRKLLTILNVMVRDNELWDPERATCPAENSNPIPKSA